MSIPIPPRLYKYQPFSAPTLSNLAERKLWFSSPADFNDPLDCGLYLIDGEIRPADARRAFEYYRGHVPDPAAFQARYAPNGQLTSEFLAELARGAQSGLNDIIRDQRGVACFATTPSSLLLWAHYADGHRGFCLEFDTSADFFGKAHPVSYAANVPVLNAVDFLTDRPAEDLFEAIFLTKSKHWSYEEEWRLVHKEPRTAYTYHWKVLTGVYLGTAMPAVHKEIIALVLRDSPTLLYDMKLDRGSFALRPVAVTHQPLEYK